MKNVIFIFVLTILLNARQYEYNYCSDKIFTIYYIPLGVNTFIPVTREDILKNKPFKIPSCKIFKLFNKIENTKGLSINKNSAFNIRILIKDNRDNEIILTQQKEVLSIRKEKIYKVDKKLINDVLDEVSKVGDVLYSEEEKFYKIKKAQKEMIDVIINGKYFEVIKNNIISPAFFKDGKIVILEYNKTK